MKGKAGAWVETDGHIAPDANDQAMAKRTHVDKVKKSKKAGGDNVSEK